LRQVYEINCPLHFILFLWKTMYYLNMCLEITHLKINKSINFNQTDTNHCSDNVENNLSDLNRILLINNTNTADQYYRL